jgi:hypothetical protein
LNWKSEEVNWYYRASNYAFERIFLSNRRFRVVPITIDDCSRIDPVTYYLPCYIASKTVKSAMLFNLIADIPKLITALEFMKATNLRLKMTETSQSLDMFSSVADYPSFTRLSQGYSYYFLETILYQKYLKYTSIHLFLTNIFGTDLVDFVNAYFERVGTTVATPRDQQELDYYNPDPEFFSKAAQQVVEAEIRPIQASFYYMSEHVKFMEALEAAGVGPEDVVILTNSHKISQILAENPENTDLILKYAPSYLTGDPAFFVGDLGADLEQEFFELWQTRRATDCYDYDQVKQAITAFDFAIRRGLNFYDWKDMDFAVRAVRFVGCSGFVTQSTEHNDRKDSTTHISHFQEDEQGVLKDVKVMEVAVTGSQYYYIRADVVWADGGNETPKQSLYTYKDCPFPEEYKQDSPKSSKRSAGIYFGLCGYAVAVAVAAYFLHYRRVKCLRSNSPSS